MTRRKQRQNPITNVRVEVDGRAYRVCYHYQRPILIGLKCPGGGERLLKHDTRRFKQILASVPKEQQP